MKIVNILFVNNVDKNFKIIKIKMSVKNLNNVKYIIFLKITASYFIVGLHN